MANNENPYSKSGQDFVESEQKREQLLADIRAEFNIQSEPDTFDFSKTQINLTVELLNLFLESFPNLNQRNKNFLATMIEKRREFDAKKAQTTETTTANPELSPALERPNYPKPMPRIIPPELKGKIEGVWYDNPEYSPESLESEFKGLIDRAAEDILANSEVISVVTKSPRGRRDDFDVVQLVGNKNIDRKKIGQDALAALPKELKSFYNYAPSGKQDCMAVYPYPGDQYKAVVEITLDSRNTDKSGRSNKIGSRLGIVINQDSKTFQELLAGKFQPSDFSLAALNAAAAESETGHNLFTAVYPRQGNNSFFVVDFREQKIVSYSPGTQNSKTEQFTNVADFEKALQPAGMTNGYSALASFNQTLPDSELAGFLEGS